MFKADSLALSSTVGNAQQSDGVRALKQDAREFVRGLAELYESSQSANEGKQQPVETTERSANV